MTNFVYCFECVSPCKVQGKKYIGSTTNLRLRYFYHLKGFREHNHHNPELMKWYNKKNTKFKFYILEKVEDKSILFDREQYYIDKNIAKCFNIVDVWGNFLKKPQKLEKKYLKLKANRTNKQQRAIKKWIKTSRHIIPSYYY